MRFRTIFPGWYAVRAAHLHFKIDPTPTAELTSQLLFLPQAAEMVYELWPYDLRGPSPTTNATDAFFDPALLMPTHKLAPALLGPLSSSLHMPQLVAGKTIVID